MEKKKHGQPKPNNLRAKTKMYKFISAAGAEILPLPKRRFIAQSLSCW